MYLKCLLNFGVSKSNQEFKTWKIMGTLKYYGTHQWKKIVVWHWKYLKTIQTFHLKLN